MLPWKFKVSLVGRNVKFDSFISSRLNLALLNVLENAPVHVEICQFCWISFSKAWASYCWSLKSWASDQTFSKRLSSFSKSSDERSLRWGGYILGDLCRGISKTSLTWPPYLCVMEWIKSKRDSTCMRRLPSNSRPSTIFLSAWYVLEGILITGLRVL